MRRRFATVLSSALLAGALASMGCPGAGGGLPAGPDNLPGGASQAGKVDPAACGSYSSTDLGAKLKGFLEASVQLEDTVVSAEAEMKASCAAMAGELGVPAEGSTAEVCNGVADAIRENLSAGLKAGAKLTVDYKPAECTVNVDAAAQVAAQCEAQASGEVAVTCEGTCQGTCEGACDGECVGGASGGGASGACNGQCKGTCSGECSGGCEGHADVQASAECEAQAEVKANVEAECTEPEVTVEFDGAVVVDKPRVDKVVAALKTGLPQMLQVSAKVEGPVRAAFTTWAKTARDLGETGVTGLSELGQQAACVSGQLAAAASSVAKIQSSIDVQVEVSASVSASASAEGEGSASAGG